MDRAGPAEQEGAAAQARPASDECLAPEFVADMVVDAILLTRDRTPTPTTRH